MSINKRIQLLRTKMLSQGIDAYIIPSSDPHKSEYVAERWKSRQWISGFSGSAGLVVITQNHAGLWTDSRYFLQAEYELEGSEFILHKVTNQFAPQYIDWLKLNLSSNCVIGFDGLSLTVAQTKNLKKAFGNKNCTFKYETDLIGEIWTDRPEIPSDNIFDHDIKYAGKSRIEKISDVRGMMEKDAVDYFIVSTLDDLAWLLNIRGKDVQYNPVAIAYCIVGTEQTYLFVNENKVDNALAKKLADENIRILPYDQIVYFVKKVDQNSTVGYSADKLNQIVFDNIICQTKEVSYYTTVFKAVKNEHEIGHFRNAMIKDGVALTKTFMWLEENIGKSEITEVDVSNKLAHFRSQQEGYFGESFGAIVGYKGNGAIIHYHPEEESCAKIEANGVLLVDSGGQYFNGTTDITRTFCFDPEPSAEVKRAYTNVLKGHIALDRAIYPVGSQGIQLDILARKPLWENGLNYLHGTGHGVGFFLNVHEDPQGFTAGPSPRSNTVLEKGMVTSNEPGYYETGKFGIRIENLILTKESNIKGFYEHETLTLFPIETSMIDIHIMSDSDINWLNNYHNEVFRKLNSELNDNEREWLKDKCKALVK